MALAIILLALVVASVLFHIFSPWHATDLASNWGSIDTTITITVVITGIFFVAIGAFLAYSVYRFKHRPNQRADYEPENKKLEWILIWVTTIGICALLAPGLFVYGDFVRVPANAMELEAVGQQWRWTYRLPGEDGILGKSAIRHINAENPFGLDPNDPDGQDDVLVMGNEVHVPVDQPIKVLLRSKDVLHDLYVPQFRVKMDSVPGLVSYMWFTPTKLGEYEVLCSELCGVGHYNMRGKVVVDEASAFQDWLAQQPTFAETLQASLAGGLVEQGKKLAEGQGCLACHSVDGSKSIGPGWKGTFGKLETLADGSTVTVDAAYLKESITNPNAKLVQGYPPVMIPYELSDEQLDALVAYIESLGEGVSDQPVDDEPVEMREVKPLPETKQPEQSELKKMEEVDPAELGRQLANSKGCLACHSMDGSKVLGPSWKGMWGKTEELADGSRVVVDEAYFKESIANPNVKVVKGFPPVMTPYQLTEEELQALIALAKSMAEQEEQSENATGEAE